MDDQEIELNRLRLIERKWLLEKRFLLNKLKFCNIEFNDEGKVKFKGGVHKVLGVFDNNIYLKDLFVDTPEAREYLNGIIKLRPRMLQSIDQLKDLPWSKVPIGNDTQNPFQHWNQFSNHSWQLDGQQVSSKKNKSSDGYYLVSPGPMIPTGQDFYISFKAKAPASPCDLTIVVGGNMVRRTIDLSPELIPEDNGYAFAFGALSNRETCIQVCVDRSKKSDPHVPIIPGKVYDIVAERIGGLIKFKIDGQVVVELVDANPVVNKEGDYISFYTFGPEHCFWDLEVKTRPTTMNSDLVKDIEKFHKIILEVKQLPGVFVEVELDENALFIRDVTEIVKVQQEASRIAEKQIEHEMGLEKIEVIGRLAGGTAHNFNNALMIIQGLTELLDAEVSDKNEKWADYIQKILHQCKNSSGLVKQLLDYSPQRRIVLKYISLNEVMSNVTTVISSTFNPNIIIDSPVNQLPINISGDQVHLETAILNLALNSKDAMNEKGTLRLSVGIQQLDKTFLEENDYRGDSGDYACITIEDNGVGMDEETKEKVFNPFFTTKPEGEGTGLGLSSVFGTIQGHDGFIVLSSELNKGAKFDIYLPLLNDSCVVTKKEASVPSPVAQKISKKILVLDDEEIIGDMLDIALTAAGYEVFAFKDSKEAIHYYENHWQEIDLSILDIVMPSPTGVECFDSFQNKNSEACCIFMSGYSGEDESYERLIDRKGVLSFQKKPFDLNEMTAAVDNVFKV